MQVKFPLRLDPCLTVCVCVCVILLCLCVCEYCLQLVAARVILKFAREIERQMK